jgi:aspartate dehydrogenase
VRRVVVVGAGAIGRPVADELRAGLVPAAELAGVVTTSGALDSGGLLATAVELVTEADLVVEVAGQAALRQWAPLALGAGVDVLAASVGALADVALRNELLAAGPGTLRFVSGAIGGLDLLRAACREGGISEVRLTTTKSAKSLGLQITEPAVVLEGTAAEAALAQPRLLNVAAALALAVGDWDLVTVRLIADPDHHMTHHVVEASGQVGNYRFDIINYPSAANPMTSAITVQSVLRALEHPDQAWDVV